MSNVLLIGGDGIGPEVLAEARKVLDLLNESHALGLEFDEALQELDILARDLNISTGA